MMRDDLTAARRTGAPLDVNGGFMRSRWDGWVVDLISTELPALKGREPCIIGFRNAARIER
jgi:hypothetical protein